MNENSYLLCAIGVMSLVTVFLRFAPFLIFRQNTPKVILHLGKVLPEAIIAMLVVYCLKDISLTSGTYGIPQAIALAIVFSSINGNTIHCCPFCPAPSPICF